MKKQTDKTSLEYTRGGITVRIRPTVKDGIERFVADYRVKGVRKLVWRSTLADARAVASAAVDKIVAGQAEVLQLTNADVHIYLRARDTAAALNKPLDQLVIECADAMQVLAGRASLMDVCREWEKRHDRRLPSKTIADATADCLANAVADGKSRQRIHGMTYVFKRLNADLKMQVAEVTPSIISQWLAGLPLGERSRRNIRDGVGFLCRFCVLRGYLTKGTDWLENVQKYSNRKLSEIEIYSPDELDKLLSKANGMTAFIVIQAFAGLRHAEVARLDWQDIDLDDGFIEVKAKNSKTGERRLIPMAANLKACLLPLRQPSGPLCSHANTWMQLIKIAAAAGVASKRNGLRHSFISYRVAQSADVPRVADEAGNSVQIIRQHYLRRVKPAEAVRWFSIAPAKDGKIQLPVAV